MPRGIPKAKTALARVEAAIEALQPLHQEILAEDKRLSEEAAAMHNERARVKEKLNQSMNTLSNLGAMKRSYEQNQE